MAIGKIKIAAFMLFSIFSISFVIGIFFSSFFDLNWQKLSVVFLLILSLLLFAILINLLLSNRVLALAGGIFVFLLLGVMLYSHYDQKAQVVFPYNQEVTFQGKIVNNPEKDYKKQRVIVESEWGRILVNAPHYPELKYGEKVSISGKIEKPGIIQDFDYGKYLKPKNIFAVIYQSSHFEKSGISNSFSDVFLRSMYEVPRAIERSLNRNLPEPQASLAAGLILGVKRNIPDYFQNDLNVTGLTHIIALSGYNVTIIIKILMDLLSASRISRKKSFVIGVFAVIFFVVMTGAAPSVIRAAIFSLLVIFGETIGRKGYQTNILLLAATLMLIFNPYLLRYDVGFQLSFLAFIGLIYLSPLIKRIFEKSRLNTLPNYIKAPLIETLGAQIMVAPLIITYFGRFSAISPIANLFVLWIIPLAMLLAFATGIAGLIFSFLGVFVGYFAWPVLEYIIKVSGWLAKIPFASFEIKKGLILLECSSYIIIILFAVFLKKFFQKIE